MNSNDNAGCLAKHVKKKIVIALSVYLSGGVVNALDYKVIVNEFKLKSRNYVHFQTKKIGKDMNHSPQPEVK